MKRKKKRKRKETKEKKQEEKKQKKTKEKKEKKERKKKKLFQIQFFTLKFSRGFRSSQYKNMINFNYNWFTF